MKPEEAIETLTTMVYEEGEFYVKMQLKAMKLGIQGLKREIANRDNPDFVIVGKLPGETDE